MKRERRAAIRRKASAALAACLKSAGSLAGPDNDKVVVHHIAPVHAKAIRDELVFESARMHQHHIDIALFAKFEGTPPFPRQ